MTVTLNKPQVREYMSTEQVQARYPRLLRSIQWEIIGSTGEAGACIRDYRVGLDFSCEAVSHSGLRPLDRILDAIRHRHTIRAMRGGRL